MRGGEHMDEQRTQTASEADQRIPLLLIARELWQKLGLIVMFAVTAAACGTPAAARIDGFTAMMYDMARNVVRPLRSSCETEDPLSLILKNESITLSPPIRACRNNSRRRYAPVEPKPDAPRSVSSSSSTSSSSTTGTFWITSWAMRSPRSMWMGSESSRLTATTFSSPR